MTNLEKALKISLALVVVLGISSVSFLRYGDNRAQAVFSYQNAFSPNNTNEVVLRAQTKLKELNLYSGRLSGLFGLRTRNSIILFQKNNNLKETGILDIPTQNALFNIIPVTEAEADEEYLVIDYTEKGDEFLKNWLVETKNKKPDDYIQLKGKISFYGENKESPKFIFYTENEKYSLENISANDLSVFIDKYVIVSGFLLKEINELGIQSIYINYTDKDSGFDILDREEEFKKVRTWVKEKYREEGEEVFLLGAIFAYDQKTVYKSGGNSTNIIFYTENEKYSLENISSLNLENFNGKTIKVRGLLLKDYNSFGLKTIVVNYFEDSREDEFLSIGYGSTEEENLKFEKQINSEYRGDYKKIEYYGEIVVIESHQSFFGSSVATMVILVTDNNKYSIENVNYFDLTKLHGKKVKITGYLVNQYEDAGYQKIIVNHK